MPNFLGLELTPLKTYNYFYYVITTFITVSKFDLGLESISMASSRSILGVSILSFFTIT